MQYGATFLGIAPSGPGETKADDKTSDKPSDKTDAPEADREKLRGEMRKVISELEKRGEITKKALTALLVPVGMAMTPRESEVMSDLITGLLMANRSTSQSLSLGQEIINGFICLFEGALEGLAGQVGINAKSLSPTKKALTID
jgi:hypothetical protein